MPSVLAHGSPKLSNGEFIVYILPAGVLRRSLTVSTTYANPEDVKKYREKVEKIFGSGFYNE